MTAFQIRPTLKADYPWIEDLVTREWASTKIVTKGKIYCVDQLPGFVALEGKGYLGLASYHIESQECELTSLNSLKEGVGIGTALLDAVRKEAISAGCRRLWLITTNDNLHAIRFYQKRGYHLVAVYPNAIEQSRKIKPEIPLIGNDRIPLRDEIELELNL